MSEEAKTAWEWPEDMTSNPSKAEQTHRAEEEQDAPKQAAAKEDHAAEHEETAHPSRKRKRRRHYNPRQCRICLEEVLPTFETPTEGIASFFNPSPKVTYISSDPESGRLLRPCKCRGSQAYVHEGCLQEWRHADSRYGARNYYECPTCKFRYRLERMKWSRLISNTLTQIALTTFIMFIAVFLLGFVADPIINLYFEPTATITNVATGSGLGHSEFEDELLELDGWSMHFLKGLTSIGLLGFLKVVLMAPLTWFNFRTGGIFGGFRIGGGRNGRVRAGVTGRDRTENTFWIVVIIGVVTFLAAVWTWVRRWSRRTLEKASERIIDVNGEDNDEDDDEEEEKDQKEAPKPHEQTDEDKDS